METREIQKPTMLFDGDCGFCRKWIEKWRRKTGDAVLYFPYQEKLKDFPQVMEQACKKAVQLILPNGEVFSGAQAAFKALAIGGNKRWLLWFYKHVPLFGFISEWIYQWIARHRMQLSPKDRGGPACPVA